MFPAAWSAKVKVGIRRHGPPTRAGGPGASTLGLSSERRERLSRKQLANAPFHLLFFGSSTHTPCIRHLIPDRASLNCAALRYPSPPRTSHIVTMPRYKRSAEVAQLDAPDEPQMAPEAAETLKELRNMWEFASLMQYIFLFGNAVKIDEDFDIEVCPSALTLATPPALRSEYEFKRYLANLVTTGPRT